MKFSIKDFFSKCDQIWRRLRIWSYLLKKYSIENFIFCAMKWNSDYEMRQFYHKIQQLLENVKFITMWCLVLSRNLEDRCIA